VAKSYLRSTKASGSTKRLVAAIVARGERTLRRRFVAADRQMLREFRKGGHDERN
jgi:hypothetical protein